MKKTKLTILLSICLFNMSILFAQNEVSPIAKKDAQVISGNTRFTILTPELIRMEWSENGSFVDDASLIFINRNLPVPKFKVENRGKNIIIKTEKLEISYLKNSGKFTSENLSIKLIVEKKPTIWKPGIIDSLNLKGTFRTLDGVKGGDLKKLEDGILSRSGWALIDDSKGYLFDGDPNWNWVKNRSNNDTQDWYFFGYGNNYKKALYDYTQVAGKIPMPPLFAFGYWYSRYWTYSDKEMRELIESFKRFDIPLDVMVIDMDWHETYGNLQGRDQLNQLAGWTGYTWNKNLFPDPEKFLKWTDKQNIKTSLNLHPASGVASNEEKYDSFCKEYGWDSSTKKFVPFRITDKKWVNAYFNTILDPISNDGVDFWWLDWQQYKFDSRFTNLTNTWWLNYVFYTRMEKFSNKRPLLYHRWGGMGNHRYQIGFSGDAMIDWSSLAFQVPFTSTASNVGYGYWSHDIGGHQYEDHAKETTPEIYTRWIQFGAFSPILRTHATKGAIERRIYMYPNHFNIMRDAIVNRYRFVPYIYSAARKAYDTGISIVRPMYYDYPDQEQAYKSPQQYMFGEDILVSPIILPLDSITNLSSSTFWLPSGNSWYELNTGITLDGGKTYTRYYALNEYPIFVKSGTIIPMFSDKVRRLDSYSDTIVLKFIPGKSSTTSFYEDNGNSNDYQKNQFATTIIDKTYYSDDSIKIVIHSRKGTYTGIKSKRFFELHFPSTLPIKNAFINNQKITFSDIVSYGSWTYNGQNLENIISTGEQSTDSDIEIIVTFQSDSKGLLKNKLALFSRLPFVCNAIRMETAKRWPGVIPNEIFKMEQIPTMITYDPNRTNELLNYIDENYKQFIRSILELKYADPERSKKIIQHLPDIGK
ncbi:MAG: TIM-barrel domain-containing protein [Tenuifilaceae bacterium]